MKMTIQEAIKSEKPFRRPHWAVFAAFNIESSTEFKYVKQVYPGDPHTLIGEEASFNKDDILATDWKIKK